MEYNSGSAECKADLKLRARFEINKGYEQPIIFEYFVIDPISGNLHEHKYGVENGCKPNMLFCLDAIVKSTPYKGPVYMEGYPLLLS